MVVAAGPDPAVLPPPSWLAADLAGEERLLPGGVDALPDGVRAVARVDAQPAALLPHPDYRKGLAAFPPRFLHQRLQVCEEPPENVKPAVAVLEPLDVEPRGPVLEQLSLQFLVHRPSAFCPRVGHSPFPVLKMASSASHRRLHGATETTEPSRMALTRPGCPAIIPVPLVAAILSTMAARSGLPSGALM